MSVHVGAGRIQSQPSYTGAAGCSTSPEPVKWECDSDAAVCVGSNIVVSVVQNSDSAQAHGLSFHFINADNFTSTDPEIVIDSTCVVYGHASPITAVALDVDQAICASCSVDMVAFWNVQELRQYADQCAASSAAASAARLNMLSALHTRAAATDAALAALLPSVGINTSNTNSSSKAAMRPSIASVGAPSSTSGSAAVPLPVPRTLAVNLPCAPHAAVFGSSVIAAQADASGSARIPMQYLAVCAGSEVYVYAVDTGKLLAVLQGHAGRVNSVAFVQYKGFSASHQESGSDIAWLISVSDDRTFIIWDLLRWSMLYQSAIMGTQPITCVAVDSHTPRFVVGSSDGMLRLFFIEDARYPAAVTCPTVHSTSMRRLLSQCAALGTRAAASSSSSTPAAASSVVISAGNRRDVKRNLALQLIEELMAADDEKKQVLDLLDDGTLNDDDRCAQLAGPPVLTLMFAQQAAGSVIGSVASASSGVLCVGWSRGILLLHSSSYAPVSAMLFAATDEDDNDDAAHTGIIGYEHKISSGMRTIRGPAAATSLVVGCPIEGATNSPAMLLAVARADSGSMFTMGIPLISEHGRCPVGTSSSAAAAAAQDAKAPLKSGPQLHAVIRDHSNLDAESLLLKSSWPSSSVSNNAVKRSSSGTSSSGSKQTAAKSSAGSSNAITFHSKIKSSGYGAAPAVTRMHTTAKQQKQATEAKRAVSNVKQQDLDQQKRAYPLQCGGSLHSGPILRAAYAADGRSLVTCSTDGTASLLRLPLKAGASSASSVCSFSGHNGPVRSVAISARKCKGVSGKVAKSSSSSSLSSSSASRAISATDHAGERLVLTASADRTARLWIPGRADPLLVLSSTQGNTSAVAAPESAFPAELIGASFFYQDKFILCACKSTMHMFKYRLDDGTGKTHDIDRLRNSSQYRSVFSYSPAAAAQQITAFGAVNSFRSGVMACAWSNRTMDILDMTTGQVAHSIEAAHSRAIHTIRFADYSHVADGSESDFNSSTFGDSVHLFLSSSLDGSVKMWDMRQATCVRRLESHVNRQQHVGLNFSPCLRYVATGSEDKQCYMYDLGKGVFIEKIGGHTDVVSDAVFHPLHPQLATVCYDGRLRLFTDQDDR